VAIQPEGVTTTAPLITDTAEGAITLMASAVTAGATLTTPELNAGAATVSGIPM